MRKTSTFFLTLFLLGTLHSYAQDKIVYGPGECHSQRAADASMEGHKHTEKGDHHKALIAYTRAVSAEPNCAAVHLNVGGALSRLDRNVDALESYKRALQYPTSLRWTIFHNVGITYVALGHYDDAQKAYSEAIRLEPKNSSSILARSRLNLILNKIDLSVSDAKTFIRMKGWRDKNSLYAILVQYLSHRQDGQNELAAKILDEAAAKANTKEWPYPIIRRFRNEISDDELMKLAVDTAKTTEVKGYLGTDLMIGGKLDEARQHLTWVRDNGTKTYTEYHLAISRLSEIESKAPPK